MKLTSILVAASTLVPLSLLPAGSANAAEGAKKPAQAAGPIYPDWDKRAAGQSLTLTTKSADKK